MTTDPWPPEGTLVRFRTEDGLRMFGRLVRIRGSWFVRVPIMSMHFPVDRHEIEVIDEKV